jgi:hypothetical protein
MFEEFAIPKHDSGRILQSIDNNNASVAGNIFCFIPWLLVLQIQAADSCCTAADILEDLSDHDALYITEDTIYQRCEALARC